MHRCRIRGAVSQRHIERTSPGRLASAEAEENFKRLLQKGVCSNARPYLRFLSLESTSPPALRKPRDWCRIGLQETWRRGAVVSIHTRNISMQFVHLQ